jgi:integrase
MARRGNGEGSIRKRKDGSWEARYTTGVNPKTGKFTRKSVYGRTRAEVKDKLTEKMEQVRKGLYCGCEKLRVSEWLDTYLWDIKYPNIKPKTFSGYEEYVRKYVKPSGLAKMKMQDVRRFHIQTFVEDMKEVTTSAFTIHAVYSVIRNAFNEAEKRGVIPISFVSGISLPKKKPKETRILTIQEQEHFLAVIKKHRLEAAFIVALTTGIREGELTALTWNDYKDDAIHITKNAVRVPLYNDTTHEKTGSHILVQDTPKTTAGLRRIPLLPIAKEALYRHRIKQNNERMKNRLLYINNNLIFCNKIGMLYDPKTFYTTLRKILDGAGMEKIKFHALRHTFATRGLESGIAGKSLQTILGHESPEMVAHYQHLLEEQAQVEIDKLADVFS